MDLKITIIGCGNAGLVHAAKLVEKGFRVGLLKTSDLVNEEFFSLIRNKNGYYVKDDTNRGNRFWVKPEFITKDIQLAIDFADILMVSTTTLQHEFVAKKIAPFVKTGQIIILAPGYMGSLLFKKFIQKEVVYSEWETTAYNGRIIDSEYVRVSFYNPRNAISVLPVNKKEKVKNILSNLFANTKYIRENVLESALHNPNLIVHTIGMLFSAARIEKSNGEFWMYKEAFTPSILRVINLFDNQKNEVLKRFNCNPLNYFDAAKWRNEEDLSKDALEVFQEFSESSNKGPAKLNHRYLLEDVPMGLCLFSSIGKVVGVDTTISDSIIILSSALLNIDFWAQGRTIQSLLSKENVSKSDIDNAILS